MGPAAGPAMKLRPFTYSGASVKRWASSERQMMAAADPSATPLQSNTPSWPATIGDLEMVFEGHLLAELRPRVEGTVVVVLPRDAGHDLLHLLGST